ncbi:MAG: hypothetical protein B6I20_01540 [Bacteroidetes bacterium 4572_117]|nr:MAG: hypothetical protein B6I20_01540 [Bacteroidetes bacterium 4572_117]
MNTFKIITIISLLLLFSCKPHGYEYNEGSLPDIPVNLESFNSEYDDYNSTAPTLGWLIPFCFSTNRNSSGNDFDIIYRPMDVSFSKTTGVLDVTNGYGGWGIYQETYTALINGLRKMNTSGNEFGPYLLFNQNGNFSDFNFLFLYATDVSGNFQINYTYNTEISEFSDNEPIAFLNSEFNDLYPAFNTDFSKIYFCSDRENDKFDIFSVDINSSGNKLIDKLADPDVHEVNKNLVISSNFDDKCPYIFDDKLIFASNRPGGFGGYDLYYSVLESGEWTEPVNFGAEINTEFDEYRPILFDEGVDYNKHMMVFSSNRTGGKGGFDLYFVGVKH